MRVPARVEYACLALLDLARRHPDPKPIPIAEVADKHKIPQRFLVQIMLQMKTAGLVATTRGSSGGYRLARAPEKITLADILRVLDSLEEPEESGKPATVMAARLQVVWKQLAEHRSRFLERISLRDLLLEDHQSDYVI